MSRSAFLRRASAASRCRAAAPFGVVVLLLCGSIAKAQEPEVAEPEPLQTSATEQGAESSTPVAAGEAPELEAPTALAPLRQDLFVRTTERSFPAADALEVRGADGSWRLEELTAAGTEADVVLYIDATLARPSVVRRFARQLLDDLDALTRLGSVEIVLADPTPRSTLPPTRDQELLRPALERLALNGAGEEGLAQVRSLFLTDRSRIDRRARETGGDPFPELEALALESVETEVTLLQEQQDALIGYLAARRAGATDRLGVLFWIATGWGADLVDFYLSQVPTATGVTVQAASRPRPQSLGSAASALGWMAFPIVPSLQAEGGRGSDLENRPTEETPLGFRLRLGREPRRSTVAGPDLRLAQQSASWEAVAQGTGGSLVDRTETVSEILESLATTQRVTLSTSTAPEGLATLDLVHNDRTLPASGTALGSVPESLSRARIRQAFAGELGEGPLEILARLELPEGLGTEPTAELIARTELRGHETSGAFRVTVGLHLESGRILIHHALASADAAAPDIWEHRSPVRLAAGTDSATVLIEDLASAAWGATVVDFVDLGIETSDFAPTSGERPVRLRQTAEARRGRVLFTADAHESVDRVEFLLNGRRVATKSRPPFAARVDLGRRQRLGRLEAIAFDQFGNELGRDRLVVNEPPSAFWVQITSPEPGSWAGPVLVAADLKVPSDGQLEELRFYFKDRLVSTTKDAPYETTVRVPVGDANAYVRVQAALVDGRTVEDVLLLNRPGFGASIGVDLVELFVVATDRNGKPVHDLERASFEVFEDKVQQSIEAFELAGDLPLTVGLAIDSSASLFRRMPAVKRAASEFVEGLDELSDRAFLVGFGSQPALLRGTTTDLDSVKIGIGGLQPRGTTAVWGAVSLALEQLEGVRGRKALVVFYDGDDEDSESAFRRCLDQARRAHVPIYLVLVNNEAARSDGRSFSTRSFVAKLDRLARAGGGKVYYVSTEQDLRPIFRTISDELRSHYLLTYYPVEEPGGPQWREVEVKIDRRGIQARTIEGRLLD